MTYHERHSRILEFIEIRGKVSVDELVRELSVTPQSVRSDLRKLENQGLLVRFHGGARAVDRRPDAEYEKRRETAAAEKRAIGQYAASLIPNDASVFINIGTTTEFVGEALKSHTGLLIVTNNINLANNVRLTPQNEIIVACGFVRANDGGIVGDTAVDFVSQFRTDFAIVGVAAIERDGTLLNDDIREVKVTQAIIKNARKVILVADSAKLGQIAPIRTASMTEVDVFVTDHMPCAAVRALCEDAGIELIELNSR